MCFTLFIKPTSVVKIVSKVGGKSVEALPVVGATIKYSKKAAKVTKITNPVKAASYGIGVMFDYCFGPVGAKSFECAIWFTASLIGGVTCNPLLIAFGAEMGELILDDITGD